MIGKKFQSTPLAGGATAFEPNKIIRLENFNPRPSREGRLGIGCEMFVPVPFQSTPLAGGATSALSMNFAHFRFQSTPLAGGATYIKQWYNESIIFQSTPLAGGATYGGKGVFLVV